MIYNVRFRDAAKIVESFSSAREGSQHTTELGNSAEADVARNSKSKSAKANDTKTESDKF